MEAKIMNYPRIVIAAPSSGSGKTTITCALLEALRQKNLAPCAFKCGPDYIDPMYHRNVIGIPSGNLDLFFTDEDKTRNIFCREFSGSIAVIEGVMGLFDGLGGTQEEASTYHLAKALDAPVLLVVDAKGVGRSVLATIRGFLEYDTDNRIRGILLNRVSARFGETLRALIEAELGIPVVGFFPEQKERSMQSRHLGLVLPDEIQDLQNKLKANAALLTESVNIHQILAIANSAPEIEGSLQKQIDAHAETDHSENPVRIAIAKDEAFCFYYRENLELLQRCGAELIPFSPIHDETMPENIHGLLIGGGYPELHLAELAANQSIRNEIRHLAEAGIPIRGECGGFMYLSQSIEDPEDGGIYEMVGLTEGHATRQGMSRHFGYITLTPKNDTKGSIRAHEFHYYDTTDNGDAYKAVKPVTEKTWNAIIRRGNQEMGFPHLYYPSNPEYAKQFVQQCEAYRHSRSVNQ